MVERGKARDKKLKVREVVVFDTCLTTGATRCSCYGGDWKQAVEHAQCMVKSEERKASAQRARYKRRLATLELESDRLRVSVMEAEAQVKAMEWSNKKVRVRVRVRVWARVRVRLGLGLGLGLECSCLVFVSLLFSSELVVFAKESVADLFPNE